MMVLKTEDGDWCRNYWRLLAAREQRIGKNVPQAKSARREYIRIEHTIASKLIQY